MCLHEWFRGFASSCPTSPESSQAPSCDVTAPDGWIVVSVCSNLKEEQQVETEMSADVLEHEQLLLPFSLRFFLAPTMCPSILSEMRPSSLGCCYVIAPSLLLVPTRPTLTVTSLRVCVESMWLLWHLSEQQSAPQLRCMFSLLYCFDVTIGQILIHFCVKASNRYKYTQPLFHFFFLLLQMTLPNKSLYSCWSICEAVNANSSMPTCSC